MGGLAAIAVRHRSHDHETVLTIVKLDLSDLGEIAPGDEDVVRRVGTKLVEISALGKMLLIGGTLRPRIARVIKALAVRRPGKTAAAGWILHPRDDLGDVRASCDIKYVQ
jgi:hypothetical protein